MLDSILSILYPNCLSDAWLQKLCQHTWGKCKQTLNRGRDEEFCLFKETSESLCSPRPWKPNQSPAQLREFFLSHTGSSPTKGGPFQLARCLHFPTLLYGFTLMWRGEISKWKESPVPRWVTGERGSGCRTLICKPPREPESCERPCPPGEHGM